MNMSRPGTNRIDTACSKPGWITARIGCKASSFTTDVPTDPMSPDVTLPGSSLQLHIAHSFRSIRVGADDDTKKYT